MKSFWKNEDGYILILMLLFMPVFVGLSLLVIDVSRGNNAQSDLYAAADAMALAAARELDGGTDAIIKAKAAMLEVDNSVSLLAPVGADTFIQLQYEDVAGNEYTVIFLRDIPDNDDDPIDQAWVNNNATDLGIEAEYVLVEVRSRDLATIFFNPATLIRNNVPIAATAVATRYSAACNVTPIFICNPFEVLGQDNELNLQTAFVTGDLHGRKIKIHPKGSNTAYPGNFGFLQVESLKNQSTSSSANAIRAIFAGDQNPTCYENDTVETKPGAAVSISQGINVRFDIYDALFKNDKDVYFSATNTRKGYLPTANGSGALDYCNQELDTGSPPTTIGYPDNISESEPGDANNPGAPGAFIGDGDWDLATYWAVNYGDLPNQGVLYTDLINDPDYNSSIQTVEDGVDENGNPITTVTYLSNANTTLPSRWDVYRFEQDTVTTIRSTPGGPITSLGRLGEHFNAAGESGYPTCSTPNDNSPPAPDEQDRRVIFAAIIDCLTHDATGQTTLPVNSFASVFMTDPMQKNGNEDSTINVEIVGLSPGGGGGLIENFVRDEAVLVR